MSFRPTLLGALFLLSLIAAPVTAATVEANQVAEVALVSTTNYASPFTDSQFDAVVTPPDGTPLRVPGFWAGGADWRFRYASNKIGTHVWRTECADTANSGLHGATGMIDVVASTGTNGLFLHGPIRVAADHRHFEHADGTPFLWLGDTWWKGLCKRMTWEGFQQLTADRKSKGFSVVQIVCGVYPDEAVFQPSWENEGGKPYLTQTFTVVNPAYFDYADRRIQCLVNAGIVPAIVGSWGRGDCDGMAMAGVEGMQRHWRHLVARYGAYPTIWIIGGESGGQLWTDTARYVQQIDPFHRPSTVHPFDSGRSRVTDETVISFDMLQTGHGGWSASADAIPKLQAAYARTPPMPAIIGEHSYEGHMQTGFEDQQRYVFWGSMLNGAPGLTYGAAGVWHASVEGNPGIANVYDWTTWSEGMNYPGSTQLGLNKQLLEQYPWWQFEPHPEWTSAGFAAGIPGGTRIICIPNRGIYNWSGITVNNLLSGVPYSVFFFDPATGNRFDQGTVTPSGSSWNTPNVPSPQDWVLVMQGASVTTVVQPDATAGQAYAGQLPPAGATFAKLSGPAWLTIAPDGALSGTPTEFDAGLNTWLVSVTGGGGTPAFLQLQIAVMGQSLFAESFRGYGGTQNATQYQSGLKVAYNGNVTGWTKAGAGAMHAVDRANTAGQSNPSNWAIMLWQDNIITSGAIAANASGQVYRVDFEASPAVYAATNPEQATQAGAVLLVQVLRGDNSVLASRSHAPGAWTGNMAFASDGFQYTGDGTGDIRLRIGPAGSLTTGHFQGAIDNIILKAVP